MRPVSIAFQEEKKHTVTWGGVAAGLLLAAALVMSAVSLFDVVSLSREKARLDVLSDARKTRPPARVNSPDRQEMDPARAEAVNAQFNTLKGILEQGMFPLNRLLGEIETARPDGVVIDEVTLSERFSVLVIRGSALRSSDVSRFLKSLQLIDRFTIEFSRGTVSGKKGFSFEMTARERRS